jgi:hypothetical protein
MALRSVICAKTRGHNKNKHSTLCFRNMWLILKEEERVSASQRLAMADVATDSHLPCSHQRLWLEYVMYAPQWGLELRRHPDMPEIHFSLAQGVFSSSACSGVLTLNAGALLAPLSCLFVCYIRPTTLAHELFNSYSRGQVFFNSFSFCFFYHPSLTIQL